MAVFDLDGTLLNTLEDLADAVNYSLAQFGMPQRTIEEVRIMLVMEFVFNRKKCS